MNACSDDAIKVFERYGSEKGQVCLIQSTTQGRLAAVASAGGCCCIGVCSSFQAASSSLIHGFMCFWRYL